jgi:acyl dehydratase
MVLQYSKLLDMPVQRAEQNYTRRDTILYALALGAGRPDAGAEPALRFTYEKELQALPTMAVVLAQPRLWVTDPEWGIDYTRLLHGEQYLAVHRPLPPEGTVRSEESVEEIYDKGPGSAAVMYLRRQLRDAAGELLVEMRAGAFIRGHGGFGGGKRGGGPSLPILPSVGRPDRVADVPTAPDQALLYRLCGDVNPLHVDPQAAKAAGFVRPILHGLCSYGVAGRALIGLYCDHDAARTRALDVRFSSPVYPGETLRVEAWNTSERSAVFRCVVVERDVVAIDNGRFEFN